MIFVTVGTNEARFDRLLRSVEGLGDGDDVIVQYGCSTFLPRNAECYAFLTFEQMVEHMRGATAVVTHAGVGSVAVALANGRCPVVMPRLQRFGEAVDDHQLVLARRLAQNGLVTLVDELETLSARHISAAASARLQQFGSGMADDLSACIHELVGRRKSFSEQQNSATVIEGGRLGSWLRQRQ